MILLSERDKIVLISPTVMEESVEKRTPYFFSMGYKVKYLEPAVTKFFQVNPDIQSVSILCYEDMWGQANLALWEKVINHNNNVNIVDKLCVTDLETPFSTEITKLAAKNPNAIIVIYGTDRVLTRMKEQKFNAKVLATSDIVEGMKLIRPTPELYEGAFFTYWKSSDEFVDKFVHKFGKEPLLEAQNHYESLRTLAMAIENNNGDILASMRKVKYQGVSGKIDFSNSNFGNQGIGVLYQVQNGEFIQID